MAVKHSADELDVAAPRWRREKPKRAKPSPSAEQRNNSSEPSSCSVSVDSALQSSPPASARDRISSVSSLQPTDSDSGGDSGSSVSSDSESELSESDEDEQDVVTIGGPKKPEIHRVAEDDGHEDLKSRIAAFLPRLEQANSLLASDGGQFSMEHVEDGEQHIEMHLGLGVLEEQGDGGGSSASGSSDDSEDEQDADDAPAWPASSGAVKRSPRDQETRRMDRLTGRCTERRGAGIEEVG